MHRSLFGLLPVVALLAACSSPGEASPSAPAPSTGAAASSSAATRIEVSLTDSLKVEMASPITVKAGTPVTFVVTNRGGTDHEFYLGDEAAQAAHAREMGGLGAMPHDDANGVGVKPGVTKELTFTFPSAGAYLAGCHVNSHYAAGMKAPITVTN